MEQTPEQQTSYVCEEITIKNEPVEVEPHMSLNQEIEYISSKEEMVRSQRLFCPYPPKRISTEQRSLMLDFMIKHPALAIGRFIGFEGAKLKQQLLKKLATKLNSLPNGVTKSEDKWFKSWQDWRSDVKSKASMLKKEMSKRGGGITTNTKSLTPLEEQLLGFLGPGFLSGHEEIPDPITISHQDSGHSLNAQSDRDEQDFIGVSDYKVQSCDSNQDELVLPLEGSTMSAPAFSPPLTSSEGSVPSTSGFISTSHESEFSRASTSAKKCKRCNSGTSRQDDDPMVEIKRQQLICLQEQNALRRAQLQLDERKTFAIENAAGAFAGAMKVLEEYLRQRRDND